MKDSVCGHGVPPMPTMKTSASDCDRAVTLASVLVPDSGLKLSSSTTVMSVPSMPFSIAAL
jgi:hypothetical protein